MQRSAEQATAIVVTEADTQAHAKESPWGHPADLSQEDCWMHFILTITNLVSMKFKFPSKL